MSLAYISEHIAILTKNESGASTVELYLVTFPSKGKAIDDVSCSFSFSVNTENELIVRCGVCFRVLMGCELVNFVWVKHCSFLSLWLVSSAVR